VFGTFFLKKIHIFKVDGILAGGSRRGLRPPQNLIFSRTGKAPVGLKKYFKKCLTGGLPADIVI
jgi:hypothetical protein